MELFKKFNKLSKKKRWEISENNAQKIAQTLEVSEEINPDWKVFNINEIAEINTWTEQIISLKNVETSKTWEKYIFINWRKYYEFNGKWDPKDSIYVLRWNSLFIWDKFEWLTNRDGVSFRYSRWIWDNICFEQHKAKYDIQWTTKWAIHLKQLYKSKNISTSEIITFIKRWWKAKQPITKDLIDQYLNWSLKEWKKAMAEAAIAKSPEVFAYMQKIKE